MCVCVWLYVCPWSSHLLTPTHSLSLTPTHSQSLSSTHSPLNRLPTKPTREQQQQLEVVQGMMSRSQSHKLQEPARLLPAAVRVVAQEGGRLHQSLLLALLLLLLLLVFLLVVVQL